jgi:predicted dehydrogenase
MVDNMNGLQRHILRIGIIGCGEVAQVAHIPNLNFLSHKFLITYLCDISEDALAHCARMVQGGQPKTTVNAEVLCASDDVDVVLICNADEYHVPHGILALKYNKWALIEKPLALCFQDIDSLIDAEKESTGKIFVGTMRRFAPAFLEAVQEVKRMDKILYARVRAIIGPNSNFIDQSGTYPRQFTDVKQEDVDYRSVRGMAINKRALRDEFGIEVTDASIRMLRILGRCFDSTTHGVRDEH